MSFLANFEKPLTERSKLNCDNTLPSIYDKNIERVETLSYIDPYIFKSKETIGFIDFFPKKQDKLDLSNQKSLSIPILGVNSDQLIQKNFQCQKSGSFNKEVSLEKKRANMEQKVNLMKFQKKRLIEKREILNKEIDQAKIDIHFEENLENYVNVNDLYNKKKEEFLQETLKKKSSKKTFHLMRRSSIELANFNLSFQKAASERRYGLEDKKKRKEEKERERIDINDNIKDIDDEIKNLRQELKEIKKDLLIHYHNLLSEGNDSRQDGISWIIISIWDLGFNIITSFLPKFLDDKCIEYIFSHAILEIEYRNIKKEIEKLKEGFKHTKRIDRNRSRIGLKNGKLEEDLAKANINSNKNISLIFEKYNKDYPINLKKFSMNSMKDFILCNFEVDENTKKYIQRLKELESLLEKKKNEKEILKNNEMKRINKEFLMYDYERRFNIKQVDLLNALVGTENAHFEISRQIKEQKEFYQKISSCKTFNFLDTDDKIVKKLKIKGIEMRSSQIKSDPLYLLNIESMNSDLF